jgi:uncharacterized repeat protein (TIGR01451 family)
MALRLWMSRCRKRPANEPAMRRFRGSRGAFGEGIPMWNGIWKLTAMVGVIGIGLFAVYQAQQGMNRTAATTSAEGNGVDPESGSTDLAEGSDRLLEPSNGQSIPASTNGLEQAARNRKAERLANRDRGQRIDLLGNFEPDTTAIKTADGSRKNVGRIETVKLAQLTQGLNFRDELEAVDEPSATRAELPKRLPDDEEPAGSLSATPRVQTIQQVSDSLPESLPDDAPQTMESGADPFGDNSRPATDKAIPSALDEPDKGQLPIDLGSDPEPPRSRRAKENAEQGSNASPGRSLDPFDAGAAAPSSNPLASPDAPVVDDFPSLGTPRPLEEPVTDPLPVRKSSPTAIPRSLPAEPAPFLNDDAPLPRSRPERTRPAIPTRLPTDSALEELDDNPGRRSREPLRQRPAQERVTPVDMVGDGVVGDVSQRGIQQPRVTIEKIAQQQAVLDQPLIYTIIVKNTGTVDAHNVVIEDRIPKGTELLGTSPRAELVGKRLIWNELKLKPNEEKKISIKVIPKQEGPIGSVARVYFATEVSAEIQVAAPQLEFTVKAPHEVRIGQSFDLIFNLKNIGKVDATNISVRDFVPEHLKHDAGTDIECPIGKLAPQEAREIVLPVTAVRTGNVINRAVLTADSGIKRELDSPIDIMGEQLVLTRTGHNRQYVERPAVFTNNIRNDGNMPVSKVRVSEVVPAGMEFETASDGGKFDANLRAVVWSLGALAPGDDKSVTVTYVASATGTHTGKITATGATGSTAAVNSVVEVIGQPKLQMETLTATGVVTVGDRITSTFRLKNTGTASARNVQLRVRLPRELRLVSVKGAKARQSDDGQVAFELIDELAPRASAAYELILEPIEEAEARIDLEISADHLTKSHRREETIQIARDALK